jgi:hypothetical protein
MRNSRIAVTTLACTVLFCAMALMIDMIFTGLILKSNWLQAGRIGRVITHADQGDIPIFGASKVVADYIPSILGPKYYNYGFAGTSQSVNNLMISFEIKEASNNPIVVDVYQGTLAGIGDVRDYIPYARYPEVEKMLRDAGEWRWYYVVPGLRYFGSYDWYAKGIISDYTGQRDAIRRGYIPAVNAAPWDRSQFDAVVRERSQLRFTFGLLDAQKARLSQLITMAPNRRFVIVLSPLHKSFFAHSSGEIAFQLYLKQLASRPNVKVIDFTHAPYPDDYFQDTAHMNAKGAAIFSRQLKAALAAK